MISWGWRVRIGGQLTWPMFEVSGCFMVETRDVIAMDKIYQEVRGLDMKCNKERVL